ncbi:hypothetical protein ES332_A06G159400v1 [Gossypium tomentosum]|uniref:Reverse transcriptase zinc-binding domain-containing protein n=1 Tax=Gossypium tomentosum TaxID=34277 RepID=A0A5D2Q5G3_GOSTO|nr:hypothetical protein ES332_A06G159400v1 [Gossypium tomentosum]
MALLAKQAKSLKEKYYPNSDFIHARLGNLSSYTWKSLWPTKGLLEKGMCCPVYVSDLIEQNSNQWKKELISTFHPEDTERIRCIPLLLEQEANRMLWRGEASGVYTVRSGYKNLIQIDRSINLQPNQIYYKSMYKKLWMVQLPSKTKILVLKTLNNFLATYFNLYPRRLRNVANCPRCLNSTETTEHVFRDCSFVVGVWSRLGISWTLEQDQLQYKDWMHKPLEGTNVKVNFDVALGRQNKKSCTGIVIRNSLGQVLKTKIFINEHMPTVFAAEALACVQAIRLRTHFITCRFRHAGRQKNKVAHILAKEGLNENGNTYLFSSLSSSVARAVEVDRQAGGWGN